MFANRFLNAQFSTVKRIFVVVIVVAAVYGDCIQPALARKWTDSSGQYSVEADFVTVKNDKVVLKLKNGWQIKVPITYLSDEDREYIKAQSAGDSPSSRTNDAVRWQPVKSRHRDARTMAIVTIEDGGSIVVNHPGQLAATLELSGGETTYRFDAPGSLWFMAEGGSAGVKYRGVVLKESHIYEFDSKGNPSLTRAGRYSAWISFEKEQPLYVKKADTGSPIRRLKVAEKVQLLFASRTGSKGWHKVQTAEGVEGWVQGTNWKETVFLERVE